MLIPGDADLLPDITTLTWLNQYDITVFLTQKTQAPLSLQAPMLMFLLLVYNGDTSV